MKNKLIEELAKTIKKTLNSMQWYEINIYTIAEACYKKLLHMGNNKYFNNLGYYKIPEVALLLTQDQWARLKNSEINYNDAYEKYRKYEIENQQLKKQMKELEKQRDRQAYIAEDLIQEKHRWTEQTRKETAKEILQIIKEEYDYIGNLERIIKERFGVEVEE